MSKAKHAKKMFPLETQDIHGALDLTFRVERYGVGNTVKLHLWREFLPFLNKERSGHNLPHGSRKTAIGLERLSSYSPSEQCSRPT